MKYLDYHLHTHVSHDAAGMILEHARQAEKAGLSELCFTEHLDFYPSDDGLSCSTIPSEAQLAGYLEELRDAAQRTDVVLRAGVELDYKPEADRWVRELLRKFSFDFVLGSVHNVDALGISDRDGAELYFRQRGVWQGCLDYYEIVEKAVDTGLFDSFAHLDLMKRFRPENSELMKQRELRDRIVSILDRMAATGTGIEINGAGLIHDPREAYPSLELLKLARERGVTILTVGSDSHRPGTVGRHLPECLQLAREAGYTHIYTFQERLGRSVSLP
ncbi:MAG: histidinol-phosphatase, partial [Chloroflexota bacterium]|jgi:histidinol-phosphatase (PHP family)